ncbi:MAG: hypothetical protein ABI120_24860 [Gemmatimonadaceae bacterium]
MRSRFSALCATTLLLLTTLPAIAQTTSTTVPRSARARPAAPSINPAIKNAPLTGTVGPEAARALSGNPDRPSTHLGQGLPASRLGSSTHVPLGIGGYVPLAVIDAPAYGRGSSTLVMAPLSPERVSAPSFYPTTEPPTWTVVPEAHPVQAWRLVDVEDTICNPIGACTRVRTRVQARWMPSLGGYAFRDRIGRIWRVE